MKNSERMEIWKEIEGSNGECEVSNLGRVKCKGIIKKSCSKFSKWILLCSFKSKYYTFSS